jgi:amidase
VGLLARDAPILRRAAQVLLARDAAPPQATPGRILLLREAFGLTDDAVCNSLEPLRPRIEQLFGSVSSEVSLSELCDDTDAGDLANWCSCYMTLMAAEAASCHGGWIVAARPELGPIASAGVEFVKGVDRSRLGETIGRREHFCRRLRESLGPRDLLCLPTAPTIAPRKGTTTRDSDYYWRTLAMTSIAGVARLPQVSMPLASAADGAPIGLSLIAPPGKDLFLLAVAEAIGNAARELRHSPE